MTSYSLEHVKAISSRNNQINKSFQKALRIKDHEKRAKELENLFKKERDMKSEAIRNWRNFIVSAEKNYLIKCKEIINLKLELNELRGKGEVQDNSGEDDLVNSDSDTSDTVSDMEEEEEGEKKKKKKK